MINPFKEINWKPTKGEKRKFGVSLMIGFPVVALLVFLGRGFIAKNWDATVPLTIGGIGFGVGFLSWAIPAIAGPFYVVWYFLSACMGIVVGNSILALFYFLVVTPIGLGLRLFGRGPISKRPKAGAATYWRDAEQPSDVQRYYRQF